METSRPRLLVLSLLMLGGCGGGEQLILPGDGQPAAIDVVEGDSQTGIVGEPLADPVIIEVTDSRGRPVEGVTVAFEFAGAGPGAAVIPETGETNSEGRADAQLVLGTAIGRQTGRARVVTEEGRQPVVVTFSATALSESANRMEAVAGEDQTGHVGQPLDDRLVVEVTDGFGNPVPNVQIDWSAEGGGSVSEATVRTGDDGRARVERVLGPAVGAQTTVATSEGLAGSPVVFAHTAIAGNASRLVIESGNEQTAAAGSAVPNDLVVRLVDADGNGVSGTGLSWVVATGGGSASPENTATDGNGRAATRWTLGETLGDQRIDAVVSGVGFISFKATATAGVPAALTISTQPSSAAGNGVPFDRQPVIQLRDSRGNPTGTAGVQVRASLGSGGGELVGTLVRSTDGSGRAVFTDLAITGDAGARTLFFSAEGYAGVASTPIQVGAPANRPPSASFTVSCQNLSCSFLDASSDPDGNIVGYSWNFGDGGTETQRNPSHAYTAPGTYQVSLTVTDNGGATNASAQSVTVTGAPSQNQAPAASFSVNCANLECSFNSDASSDPDGRIVGTNWTFGDGESSDSRNPGHEYDAGGTYQVTLTVRDDDGASHSTTRTITVTAPPPANELPDADYNWNCDGLTCQFTDNSEDDDGTVVSWSWDFGGTGTSNLEDPAHTFPGPGEYQVTLTVTDNAGGADLSTAGVEVEAPPPPNQPPTAEFTWQCDDLDCEFDGQDDDPDGDIEDRRWEFGDGSTSDGRDPSHEYATGGTYTVRFIVTDDDGASATAEHSVTVVAPNQRPTAEFSSTCVDLDCQFTDQSTDGDGAVESWSWDFDDGGAGSGERNPAHSFPESGTYNVRLTVTDNRGASHTTAHGVSVTAPPPPNQPPTAAFSPPSCTTGQPCQFSDGSGDGDGNVVSWSWVFGDGKSSNQEDPATIYDAPGTFTVTLTVTDDDGASDSETGQVTVSDPAPAGIRTLNLRQQPASTVTSGAPLDPGPEVELLSTSEGELAEPDVPISVAIGSGEGVVGGDATRSTDGNGRARFDDLVISGASGSNVTLVFTAPGYAPVDSPPILIQ